MLGSAIEIRRCFFANLGFEIRVFHNLQTNLNFRRHLAESLRRISTMSSEGKNGSGKTLLSVGERTR
jgi:hypothetical protein